MHASLIHRPAPASGLSSTGVAAALLPSPCKVSEAVIPENPMSMNPDKPKHIIVMAARRSPKQMMSAGRKTNDAKILRILQHVHTHCEKSAIARCQTMRFEHNLHLPTHALEDPHFECLPSKHVFGIQRHKHLLQRPGG